MISLASIRRIAASLASRIVFTPVAPQTRSTSWIAFEKPSPEAYAAPQRAEFIIEGAMAKSVAVGHAVAWKRASPLLSGTTIRVPSQIQDATQPKTQHANRPLKNSPGCDPKIPNLRLNIPGSPATFGVLETSPFPGSTLMGRPCVAHLIPPACREFEGMRQQDMTEAETWEKDVKAQESNVTRGTARDRSDLEKAMKDHINQLRDVNAI